MTEHETFFYLLDTSEIIEEYTRILDTPITISLFSPPTVTQLETVSINASKQRLFVQYVQVVSELTSKYGLDIDNHDSDHKPSTHPTPSGHDTTCLSCEQPELAESTEFQGITICTNCGFQDNTKKLFSSMKISYSDSERINICSKYTYEKRSHFINCIDQFQGKTKTEIEIGVIDALREEIAKYSLTSENLTKEHVSLFVKDLKLSKYYGDINILYHKLTGKKLHDITHLMDQLKEDFDTFVKVYYRLYPKDTDRRNFNYQQLLFQLLSRHKYPCTPSDFNFLKTAERKTYHEDICKEVFQELGWNYTVI